MAITQRQDLYPSTYMLTAVLISLKFTSFMDSATERNRSFLGQWVTSEECFTGQKRERNENTKYNKVFFLIYIYIYILCERGAGELFFRH